MSVDRVSFNETPDLLDRIGFQVRLAIGFDYNERRVIVGKGSLVFGFHRGGDASHGFVVDSDMSFDLPSDSGNAVLYVTMAVDGSLFLDMGNIGNVRGIGRRFNGIPWYTFNDRALVGKVFMKDGYFQRAVACSDAFWCEFEGGY